MVSLKNKFQDIKLKFKWKNWQSTLLVCSLLLTSLYYRIIEERWVERV